MGTPRRGLEASSQSRTRPAVLPHGTCEAATRVPRLVRWVLLLLLSVLPTVVALGTVDPLTLEATSRLGCKSRWTERKQPGNWAPACRCRRGSWFVLAGVSGCRSATRPVSFFS